MFLDDRGLIILYKMAPSDNMPHASLPFPSGSSEGTVLCSGPSRWVVAQSCAGATSGAAAAPRGVGGGEAGGDVVDLASCVRDRWRVARRWTGESGGSGLGRVAQPMMENQSAMHSFLTATMSPLKRERSQPYPRA